MPAQLAGSNLVITAHQFNPSVFSQLWLVRNQVLREDEFLSGCLFSDQAVNVQSEQFDLLVLPPQLQFTPKVSAEQEAVVIDDKVGGIVRALPHTPYNAIGLNFFWHVIPNDGDIARLTRSLFFDPGRRIYQLFDVQDARFGAYLSRDTLGCRLRLDIRPMRTQTEAENVEVVLFAFNFHLDLPQEGNQVVETVQRQLSIWIEAKSLAARIVHETVE